MEFLIALFAIAGLVWLVPVIQRGRLIAVALAMLGLGTVFGPDFFHLNGPIQLSIDRVVWLGMFPLAAILWRRGMIQFPRLHRIDYLLLGFVGWSFISAALGDPPPTGTPPVARWLFYILMPAGMYAIARSNRIQQDEVHWISRSAILLAVYLAVTAVLEIRGLHWAVFPKFIINAEQWEFFGRGRGPLMNPSGNGILMSIGLVATSIGMVFAAGRHKLVYLVLTLMILVGVYATLTRSAWMGGVAAIGVVLFVHSSRWQRVLALAVVVLIGGASVAGLKDQLVRLKRDKNLTAEDAEKSLKLRPLLAVVAWEMFKDRPLVGHGYGHYFANNDPYHSERGYELPLEHARTYAQHNVFLSILVDTGLIGFSLFTSTLLMLAGIGWRLAREARQKCEARWVGLMMLGSIIAYVCNGMFQDVMIIPMIHMFLFFLAGVTVTVYQTGLTAVHSIDRTRMSLNSAHIGAPACNWSASKPL
jgi:O-antigen ligase